METKIILDLCGGTGAWSEPYRQNGYDVRLITLPNYDVLTYQPPAGVYGILAAPPCTEFSFARTNRPRPTDFRVGLELVNACLRIVQEAICLQWDNGTIYDFKFWALENPKGYLRRFLGPTAYSFNPCDFGDFYTKATDLWGLFEKPKPVPLFGLPLLIDKEFMHKAQGKNGLTRTEVRSITPGGFARAFYEANK